MNQTPAMRISRGTPQTSAKSRLRSAAHRAALRFEAMESARLIDGLQQLLMSRATPEQIEAYIRAAEEAGWR